MKAMVLEQTVKLEEDPTPLTLRELPVPVPESGELLVKVSVCGVCHTELDEIEGRAAPPDLPVVPGHQVVGHVQDRGGSARRFQEGERVGVAWIFSACGTCRYCRSGQENLCSEFRATGRDADGGYAEFMTVPEAYACPIPDGLDDLQAAPLLCAGAIGYRSLRLTGLLEQEEPGEGDRLGLTGFGASGHLVLKLVRDHYPALEVYVFARSQEQRAFARELGAVWAGDTADRAPHKLSAVIDTTPAWKPVVEALANLAPGGRLVINAIRKEAGDQGYLRHLDYAHHLWMEKEIKSVANVTRRDVEECLRLAAEAGIQPTVETYPLQKANRALRDLRRGGSRGAKALVMA